MNIGLTPPPGWFTRHRPRNAIIKTYINWNWQHMWCWTQRCLHEQSIVVYKPQQWPFITGWREHIGTKLWRIALLPPPSNLSTPPTGTTRASLQAFSAYDLRSLEALVRYFHAASGFPVRDTWLRAVKCGNYSSWTGPTHVNAARYCPSLEENIMVNIIKSRQGREWYLQKVNEVRQTKSILDNSQTTTTTVGPPNKPSWELHIQKEHIIKLYT